MGRGTSSRGWVGRTRAVAAVGCAWIGISFALAQAPAEPVLEAAPVAIKSWFERVSRDYDETMRKLSVTTAPNPVLDAAARLEADRRQRAKDAAGSQSATGGSPVEMEQAPGSAPGYIGRFIAWLHRAGETYQEEVLRKLERPIAAAAMVKPDLPAPPAPPPTVSVAALPEPIPKGVIEQAPALTDAEQAAAAKAMADARAAELRRQADKAAEAARKLAEKRVAERKPAADAKPTADTAKATDTGTGKTTDTAKIADGGPKAGDAKRPPDQKVMDGPRVAADATKMAEEARKAADDIKRALDTARAKIATDAKAAGRRDSPTIVAGRREQTRATKATPRKTARTRTRCARAGTVITPPGWYVVKPGDSYWRIAEAHYGDGDRFRVIRKANKRRGTLIHPCQRLYIPR